MGFTRPRIGDDGKTRYMAVYRDVKGRVRSAGTFRTEKQAEKAWQRAEAKLAEGRVGDPSRGRMSFRRYVEETWLANHVMEPSTRENYTYSIYRHIMPEFGGMRMVDVMPEHVRGWITGLRDSGISPVRIRLNKVILSAIFSTALNDQVVFVHPCKGVKTPPVPVKPIEVITPEQFDVLYRVLTGEDFRLLVETVIESGLRWGELTELRVGDIDFASRIVTVSRAVVQVNPKFHPDGGRFWVKQYPKDGEYRRFKLSAQIVVKLGEHCEAHGLGRGDLLFRMPAQVVRPTSVAVVDLESLGLTEPNDKGRQYRHGTLSAYSAGKCRCEYCRGAFARYRAQRRGQGKDEPRKPRVAATDADRHIPGEWFRRQVWKPAVIEAKLDSGVTFHKLRHAHASWLLAGGADLQVVKERLGHGSIATTERYLHTLPDADDTALSALESIRSRAR